MRPQGSTWCIVVAAGRGERFGAPKQLAPLGDRRVLDWSVDAASAHADGVVLVVSDELQAEVEAGYRCTTPGTPSVVIGGASRSESVRAGLAAVPSSASVIVVHDAARPLASPELFDAVVAAVAAGADAAVPGVAVTDTIRHRDAGPVDRAALVAVQTPQAFRADALRAAHRGGADATDDATLVEAAGGKVVVVDGEPTNLKITHPADLALARALVER